MKKKNFPINEFIHKFLIFSNSILKIIIFKLMNFFTKFDESENEIIIPRATYAPWKKDKKFKEIYKKIKKNTLTDVLRLYYIYETCKKLRYLKADAIEIGAWRGGVSFLISSIFTDSKIYISDTFEGVVKTSDIDSKYINGMHSDSSISLVQSLFSKNKISNFKILKGVFPEQTSKLIQKKKFKFAHIDTDTYKSTKDSFEFIWPLIIKNGCVIIDDYGVNDNKGIKKLVEKDINKIKNCYCIRLLSGQALLIKI